MVSAVSDKVAVQDFIPQYASENPVASGNVKFDDVGNTVVVSKDFILSLLSLAVGPTVLDGNLGRTVDVKV